MCLYRAHRFYDCSPNAAKRHERRCCSSTQADCAADAVPLGGSVCVSISAAAGGCLSVCNAFLNHCALRSSSTTSTISRLSSRQPPVCLFLLVFSLLCAVLYGW